MANLYGSICLSDIPKELMKKVMTAKGEKIFLNISIGEKKSLSRSTTAPIRIMCLAPQGKRNERKAFIMA